LIVVERDVERKSRMTMRIAKVRSALTLGNLQGDQSEVLLRERFVFYTKQKGKRSLEFRVAMYDIVYLSKRRSRSAQADERNSMWVLRSISTKELIKRGYQSWTVSRSMRTCVSASWGQPS
jgi:hypothetical protein